MKMTEVALSWSRQDLEQRLAFRGGRHTRVNTILSGLLGCLLTALFYAALLPFHDTYFSLMFTDNGYVPYAICYLAAWAAAILFIKERKVKFQRRALEHLVVPTDPSFVLGAATVDDVTDRIFGTVDDPKYFVLFNRIVIALSNLRNLGRVTDVDEILRSQAVNDESSMETSYALVNGFVWAIPVLGFIGTVIGLSGAISGFGNVLQGTQDMEEIKVALQGVTKDLGTAFQTTLQALVAALLIQLWLTFLKKREEEFLDACAEYCVVNVVNKLRVMPYEKDIMV